MNNFSFPFFCFFLLLLLLLLLLLQKEAMFYCYFFLKLLQGFITVKLLMTINANSATCEREGGMQWGLCALRHGIQNSMEAILACQPALSTE